MQDGRFAGYVPGARGVKMAAPHPAWADTSTPSNGKGLTPVILCELRPSVAILYGGNQNMLDMRANKWSWFSRHRYIFRYLLFCLLLYYSKTKML